MPKIRDNAAWKYVHTDRQIPSERRRRRKGDAFFDFLVGHAGLTKKKHDDCCSKQGGENINPLRFEDKYRSSRVEGDKQNGAPCFNEKVGTAEIIFPLPAATHWPLFGQQADTFLRAFKLGRWATTNTTPRSTGKESESQLLRHLFAFICRLAMSLFKS